jgi:hypothetical protein
MKKAWRKRNTNNGLSQLTANLITPKPRNKKNQKNQNKKKVKLRREMK